MPDDETPPGRPARAAVGFSEALAETLCARVAAGESQVAICAEPGMPSRATLWRWVQTRPAFAQAFWAARVAGGVDQLNGRVSSFCQVTADEVFRRMCEGESVSAICADPAMPAFSTLYYWRRQYHGFAEAMRVAREIQAERFCDLGWEIACEITPDSARADRVKLAQLRWTAAILAPKRFGRLKPQELDRHWQGGGMTIYIKRYSPEVKHPTEDRLLEPGEAAFLKHIPPPDHDDDD
jgi:transposase-like protein